MSKKVGLKGLISATAADGLVRDFEFIDGFVVTLRYMSRTAAQKYADQCSIRKWNSETKQREPSLDGDRLQQMLVEKHVVEWKGLTIAVLKKVVPVDADALAAQGVTDDDEVEFTKEAAVDLMSNSGDFEGFVLDMIRSVGHFQRESLEDELGN